MKRDGAAETPKEEDKLINAIGEFGRWQVAMMILVLMITKTSGAWQQLGIIFIAPSTTFICTQTNLTTSPEKNKCYSDCKKYEYETEFENTIISQFDLICDKAWMANFTQTLNMFGVLLGSIFFGFIADRFGRRPALLMACTLQILTTMVQGFCPNYWTFATVRFFIGISTAGTMLCPFIFLVEITGPKKRELLAFLAAIPISLGEMVMPAFAYFLRSYDKFCIGVAVPNLIYVLYFFIMPESPKWLISMNRLEEAAVVMERIAKWNKLPTENMYSIAQSIADENTNSNVTKKAKPSYLLLVKTKTLRKNTICSCTIWFVLGIMFYGANQYIGQTSSNVFLAIFLAGLMQIPGMIVALIMCKYIGRRTALISLLTVCAVSAAPLAVPDDWSYSRIIKLIAGSISVSCASGTFASIYMYTSELFPTVTRNMAMGASSTVSRIGSMIAPFVAGLNVVAPWLPPAAFSLIPFLAAVACYCLPETRGKKLPE